jgi:hypothetical protein
MMSEFVAKYPTLSLSAVSGFSVRNSILDIFDQPVYVSHYSFFKVSSFLYTIDACEVII